VSADDQERLHAMAGRIGRLRRRRARERCATRAPWRGLSAQYRLGRSGGKVAHQHRRERALNVVAAHGDPLLVEAAARVISWPPAGSGTSWPAQSVTQIISIAT